MTETLETPKQRKPRTPFPPQTKIDAGRLIKKGFTLKEIAAKLDIPHRTVALWSSKGRWCKASALNELESDAVTAAATASARQVAQSVAKVATSVATEALSKLLPQLTDAAGKTLLSNAVAWFNASQHVEKSVATDAVITLEGLESATRTLERIEVASRRTLGLDQPNALNSSPIRINVLGSVRIDEDVDGCTDV